jgi:hypothetical protein
MKRSLLDITKKISRTPIKAVLTAKDLDNSTYWIFEARGYKFVDVLREIELRTTQDRVTIYVNTQNISARDYVIEQGGDGLLVKFIKNNFEYQLDTDDYIEIKGDIEQYA